MEEAATQQGRGSNLQAMDTHGWFVQGQLGVFKKNKASFSID